MAISSSIIVIIKYNLKLLSKRANKYTILSPHGKNITKLLSSVMKQKIKFYFVLVKPSDVKAQKYGLC
jgi:hypothetical protein